MVAILQRLIQKVKADKWELLDQIDKKFDELEGKLGFPSKKRYRALSSSLNTDTLIVEREWKSMAELEKSMFASLCDPGIQKLHEQLNDMIEETKIEMFVIWPLKA